MPSRVPVVVLFALLALGPGCKSKGGARPAPVTTASGAPELKAKPHVDPELLGRMRELTVQCQIDLTTASVVCPGRERQELVETLARNSSTERAASLGTLAAALSDTDPKLRLLAAGIASEAYRASLGDDLRPGAVKADDARALIEVTSQLPEVQAIQALPAAVHAAMLAGLGDALYDVLKNRPELSATAYRYLMIHGRLAAFAKIKEISQSGRPDLQLAALESVRTMQGWSEAERAAICPWAQEIFQAGKPELRVNAATLLVNCPGRAIDQLLSQSEAWLADKSLSHTTVLSLRGLCSSPGVSSAQCERLRQLLTTVAAEPALDASLRAAAQEGLKAQGPNDAKSSGP